MNRKELQRFQQSISFPDPDFLCWEWIGERGVDGYGFMRLDDGRKSRAHRLSYQWFREDCSWVHIHHVCRNHWCVNPDHLQGMRPDEHKWLHRKQAMISSKNHDLRLVEYLRDHPGSTTDELVAFFQSKLLVYRSLERMDQAAIVVLHRGRWWHRYSLPGRGSRARPFVSSWSLTY